MTDPMRVRPGHAAASGAGRSRGGRTRPETSRTSGARGPVADDTQTVVMPRLPADGPAGPLPPPDSPWPDDDAAAAAARPAAEVAASLAAGLTTLPYLGATVRRRFRLWCAAGIAGLALGLGAHAVRPAGYQASTSVEITNAADQNPIDAIGTEVALVHSRTVAARAERQLGLTENVSTFLAGYTAADVTDRIISITVKAPSAAAALQRARTLAAVFLQFQAGQLRAEQQDVARSLTAQIAALQAKISNESSAQRASDRVTLASLTKALQDYQLSNEVSSDQIVSGSTVLDTAAVLPPSKLKSPAVFAVAGLIAGLAAGIGFVLIAALASGRLRRRDDVARALSAPVRLSAGRIRAGRLLASRLLARRALLAGRSRPLQRVVSYLDGVIPPAGGAAPALAVIPLGSPRASALAVAALALARARQGGKVIVADLAPGRPAARLLGVRAAGTHAAAVGGGEGLLVVVPEDLCPAGPVAVPAGPPRGLPPVDRTVAAAYHGADLLLTLATADPSVSADYLPTWATAAVAVVTAGQSTATRIAAAAEMLRMAGLPAGSGILLSADKSDDSIGTLPPGAAADGAAELRTAVTGGGD